MAALRDGNLIGKVLSRFGWLYAALVGLGLALAGLAAVQGYKEVRLSWFGVTAEGVVYDRQEQDFPCDQGRNGFSGASGCATYTLGVRYDTAGRTETALVNVDPVVFGSLRVGGKVALRYLADDPLFVALDQSRSYRSLSLTAFVAIFMLFTGVRGLRRRVQHARLAEGEA